MDIPFDPARLDRLMDEAGLEVALVTSKHNVQALLGGHRFFWFDHMDAVGVSRYLPVLVYVRGDVEAAFYVANELEAVQLEIDPVWPSEVIAKSWTSTDGIQIAVDRLCALGLGSARIGVESAFLPMDSAATLSAGLPHAVIGDCSFVLERLRAVKRPEELAKVELASDLVVTAMLSVMAQGTDGMTKHQLVDAFRVEQVQRGLQFEYCLISCGADLNRSPSDQPWRTGEVLSMDSGGNYEGYIGNVARMAILGEPDGELVDLLARVDAIQMAAREPVRAGALGSSIYAHAHAALRDLAGAEPIHFLAHGMGLVSHEAPRLTATGPIPYAADDADRQLEAGMVISIETTMPHPRRGFIKLEDTVIVTDEGCRGVGDKGRSWNEAGGDTS